VTAAKYAILPAGGIFGALFAGWATDRLLGGRRAPVICALLLMLALLTLLYDGVSRTSTAGTVLLLFWVGFAIFGPQVLLVGTAPMDLARHGTAAAAAGFVNFMGYLGAFSGDLVTGYLAHHYSWRVAILFWAGCAGLAACVVAALWHVGPRRAQVAEIIPPQVTLTPQAANLDHPTAIAASPPTAIRAEQSRTARRDTGVGDLEI
jgi:sugar phosphate permease